MRATTGGSPIDLVAAGRLPLALLHPGVHDLGRFALAAARHAEAFEVAVLARRNAGLPLGDLDLSPLEEALETAAEEIVEAGRTAGLAPAPTEADDESGQAPTDDGPAPGTV